MHSCIHILSFDKHKSKLICTTSAQNTLDTGVHLSELLILTNYDKLSVLLSLAMTQFRVYKRRWLIMISVISLNMVGYMTTISLAPVAPTAAEYYQVSGDRIDMFPLVGMGVNVPGLLIGLFIIEKYGIKVGMRFGSTCLLLGALVRALSTFPAYEESLEGPTKFWITFTGHVIIAIGHPFLMTLATKVFQLDIEKIFHLILSRSVRPGSLSLRESSPQLGWLLQVLWEECWGLSCLLPLLETILRTFLSSTQSFHHSGMNQKYSSYEISTKIFDCILLSCDHTINGIFLISLQSPVCWASSSPGSRSPWRSPPCPPAPAPPPSEPETRPSWSHSSHS